MPTTSPDSSLFIVFDLDDTLADTRHRQPLREAGDWDAFYAACPDDGEVDAMCKLFRLLQHGPHTRVEIWTGRSDAVRNETEAWLIAHHLWPDDLKMRDDEDYCNWRELKGRWLAEAPRRPDAAVDDNLQTIAWWREQGVFALACGENDY